MQTATTISELFTPTNIIGVGAATLAVTATATAVHRLLKVDPKWPAIVAALVIAYAIVWMKPAPDGVEWLLAFFNACLLFCSALGLNEFGSRAVQPSGQNMAAPKPLLRSWVR